MALPTITTFNVTSPPPFKFNEKYDVTQAGEANTYNTIFNEAVWLYGSDIIYIKRTVNTPENIFGEYLDSVLSSGINMRLFCQELTEGAWANGTDMYSKFGLQVQDEATFFAPTLTFKQIDPTFFPKASDLIYFVYGKKLFEIQHIENEALPGMYVFGNRNSYVMKCKVYTYMHELVDQTAGNNIPNEVKTLLNIHSQDTTVFNTPIQTAASGIIDNTEVDPLA